MPCRGRRDLALALAVGSADMHLPWAHATVPRAAETEIRVMGLPVSSSPRGVCVALTGSPHGGSWCAALPVFTCLEHIRVRRTTVFLPGSLDGGLWPIPWQLQCGTGPGGASTWVLSEGGRE